MNLITNNHISTYALYATEPYLAHHGIKGMRWGVRRFQNEDGSLTAAGVKRYGAELDVNDVSRKNIARIRKGEALRRLDYAKAHNPTNTYRIGELQGRVRSAKKAERLAGRIDRGSKRAAKGETIIGNRVKVAYAVMGATFAQRVLTAHLQNRIDSLDAAGKLQLGHVKAAKAILGVGGLALTAATVGYAVKKGRDNANIRAYRSAEWTGTGSKRAIGSTEYADVVERLKRGK